MTNEQKIEEFFGRPKDHVSGGCLWLYDRYGPMEWLRGIVDITQLPRYYLYRKRGNHFKVKILDDRGRYWHLLWAEHVRYIVENLHGAWRDWGDMYQFELEEDAVQFTLKFGGCDGTS